MPANTPELGIPYPLPTDQISAGASDMQAIAESVEANLQNVWRLVAWTMQPNDGTAGMLLLDSGVANYAGRLTRVAFSARAIESGVATIVFQLCDGGVPVTDLLHAVNQPHGAGVACVYLFVPSPGAHRYQIVTRTDNSSTPQIYGPRTLLLDELVA